MRRPVVPVIVTVLLLTLPGMALARIANDGGSAVPVSLVPRDGYVRVERLIEADSTGIVQPAAIAWDARLKRLVILDAARPGMSALAPLIGAAVPGARFDAAADGAQLAYDAQLDRLIAVDAAGATLRTAPVAGQAAGRWAVSTLALGSHGLGAVAGVAVGIDALWVLDGRGRSVYRIPWVGGVAQASGAVRIGLDWSTSALSGLAIDPATGNLLTLEPAGNTLWEFTAAGRPILGRSLAEVGLHDPRGMTIAPSGDPTDPAGQTSLYIADAGTAQGTRVVGAAVVELSLTAPVLAASLANAAADTATVVQTINTAAWSPASPDPDGFDYIPSADRLLVSDSEVEETTGAGFHGVNVWFADRHGGAPDSNHHMNSLLASPTNKEPAAAAYDEVRNEIYLGKDGASSAVWVYGPGGDGIFGTADDQQLRYFTTYPHGVSDGEGLAFGNGNLYVADGLGKEIWTIAPGNDGVVGTSDDVYSHFDVLSMGQNNPEGMDFNTQTGNLWVVSNDSSSGALEVTPGGVPVSTVARSEIPALHPGGLAIAPSSIDDTTPNVWIADRGVDNAQDPNENDGKLYELSITAAPPPPPPGGNQIVNGGFEDANAQGQPTSWSLDSRFTQSSDSVHGGTFAGRHRASDNSGYKVTQDVPATAGVVYSFSGWFNVPATADAFKLVLKLQWRSAAGKGISTVTIGKISKSTADWTQLTSTMTAPAGATTGRIMMVISSLNATIYVDDFELTAPP